MSEETIDFDFNINEYSCKKCHEVFYGYYENTCPHCGETATAEGNPIEHLLQIVLNRKTRKIAVLEPDSFLR